MQFLMRFLKHFGFNFWTKIEHFWKSDSFLDSAESGAPHENTINSNEIEARTLGKATKKTQQLKNKHYENEDENQTHL